MKQFIRNYLTFNKRERNGIVILTSIIGLQLLYLAFSDNFIKAEVVDLTTFEKQLHETETLSKKEKIAVDFEEHLANAGNRTINKVVSEVTYFKFNPNNLPMEDWKRLGLSEKQIQVIKNFEAKGGKFFTKDDVKKMYCISQKQYAALEPYIVIPGYKKNSVTDSNRDKVQRSENISHHSAMVELNTADSSQLEQLKGIGAFYATSIIKLRNSLGGFINKDQLLELWKFDASKLKLIEENSTIDISKVKKRNINTFTSQELKHPYLSWKQVNGIINYRKKHGDFHSVDELKSTDLIDEETYLKLLPYLTVQ